MHSPQIPVDPYFPPDWPDDEDWEVFLPDGDPIETLPSAGDFWIDDDPNDWERLAA